VHKSIVVSMTFKGFYKDSGFLVQVTMLLVIAIFGAIASSLLFYIVLIAKGMLTVETLGDQTLLYQNPELFRVMLFFQSLGVFFFPALVLAYLFHDDKNAYLQLNNPSSFKIALFVFVSMIVVQPFINLVAELNNMIRLPEFLKAVESWMIGMEEEAQQLTESILQADNLLSLLFNIAIVAVVAAVGEEFFFRGVLQQVFRKLFRNEHAIIWTVAIIFSAVHLQFYGFIPRMLLGAYFGYLLYYTKNLWIPVLAHFTNNAFGVTGYYFLQNTSYSDFIDALGTGADRWAGVVSFLLWAAFFVLIVKCTKKGRLPEIIQ